MRSSIINPEAMEAIDQAVAVTCKNCEMIFEGNFCPNCSQKARTHRFSVKHVIHDAFHAFTHTDKGIIFLMRQMLTRPGKVAVEYNAGKRKKYFNPFTFLLIMIALNIFFTQKTNFYGSFLDATEALVKKIESAVPNPEGSEPSSAESLEKARTQTPKLLENSKLLTTVLFIPLLSLLTWLFYFKSGHNYAENVVLNMLLQGQLSVFFIVFCLVPFLIYEPLVIVLPYLYMFGSWVYHLIAYKQFFQQRPWVNFFKASIVQVIFYVLVTQVTNVLFDYL